jgi:hypothetical protein
MSTTDKLNKSIYIGGWTETDLELMSESRLWNHVICQAISDSYLGGHHEKLRESRVAEPGRRGKREEDARGARKRPEGKREPL